MKVTPSTIALIKKWKINHKLLSAKMNMPKGTFNNKLNPNHPSLFSDEETTNLYKILGELKAELNVELSASSGI